MARPKKKRRIRMLDNSVTNPSYTYNAGKEYDVVEETADELVKKGFAIYVD